MNFKINDKVVVVKITTSAPELHSTNPTHRVIGFYPELNRVYVVEGINNHATVPGLHLVGSTVEMISTGQMVGWRADCFRRLEDIQEENAFKAMLEEAKALINLY